MEWTGIYILYPQTSACEFHTIQLVLGYRIVKAEDVEGNVFHSVPKVYSDVSVSHFITYTQVSPTKHGFTTEIAKEKFVQNHTKIVTSCYRPIIHTWEFLLFGFVMFFVEHVKFFMGASQSMRVITLLVLATKIARYPASFSGLHGATLFLYSAMHWLVVE